MIGLEPLKPEQIRNPEVRAMAEEMEKGRMKGGLFLLTEGDIARLTETVATDHNMSEE